MPCGLLVSFGKHLVDQSVILRLAGRQPVVAVGVLLDLLDRDARVDREDFVQLALGFQNLARYNNKSTDVNFILKNLTA